MFENVSSYLRYKVNDCHTGLVNIAAIDAWDLCNGIIVKFFSTGGWIERITDAEGHSIYVEDLKASCPEEFFIQATIRGCLVDAPAIEDKDVEIAKLKSVISDMNNQLVKLTQQTKDMMNFMDKYKDLCSQLSGYTNKVENVTGEFS